MGPQVTKENRELHAKIQVRPTQKKKHNIWAARYRSVLHAKDKTRNTTPHRKDLPTHRTHSPATARFRSVLHAKTPAYTKPRPAQKYCLPQKTPSSSYPEIFSNTKHRPAHNEPFYTQNSFFTQKTQSTISRGIIKDDPPPSSSILPPSPTLCDL